MFEHKKIETTNLDIIRKAISYTFPKDEEAKNLHIAFLSAYSLDILSRTFLIGEGGLQVNDDQINLDRDCAEYNMRDKKILLSINKLKDDSKYISDLIAIFHETYHYATSMGVIENGKNMHRISLF